MTTPDSAADPLAGPAEGWNHLVVRQPRRPSPRLASPDQGDRGL